MNNKRRASIEEAMKTLQDVMQNLEAIKAEEELYFDNIPENLVDSYNANVSEDAICSLEEAIDTLSYVCDSLEEAKR